MQHPNFLDRLAVKIWPRFLYRGQLAVTTGPIHISIVHKLPSPKPFWKIMDHVRVEKGSLLRFHGLASALHLAGDVEPNYSVFDIVQANQEMDVTESGHHISPGDAVIVLPVDRRFIYPAPAAAQSKAADPLYYTAASPPAP